ncbi:MAG: lamin tail domain-containing protein [Phycisphaerales bacterium]|nr:lamin tail domain-containing protein [Phycisphaerales bacterium]
MVGHQTLASFVAISSTLAPVAIAQKDKTPPAPKLPIITEVLYAVPKGVAGDASKDGSRDATGDEFVEIYNPTDVAIRLTGWTLTDRNPPDAGQFLFRFPDFTLQPGETVVVFNGLHQTIPGAVGNADKAPASGNEKFSGAWVFTAGNTSSQVGFANDGDWACLREPGGEVVSCVMWGKPDEEPPTSGLKLAEVPRSSAASVQRTLAAPDAPFEAHPTVDGLRCSPGKPPPSAAGEAAPDAEKPAPAKPEKQKPDRP